MSALTTRALRTRLFFRRRLRRWDRGRSDAADVVDDLPDVLLGQRPLHPLHLGLFAVSGQTAIPDHGEDLAVAAAVVPLGVGKVGRRRILRRERSVALAAKPVAMTAVLAIERAAGVDRRRSGRNRILSRGKLGVTAPFLRVDDRRRQRHRKYQRKKRRNPTHRYESPPVNGRPNRPETVEVYFRF